jgi:hypothetical protein
VGGLAFVNSPAWSYPPEQRAYYCGFSGYRDHTQETVSGLWLPWSILLLLAIGGTLTWRRGGRGDARVWVPSLLGWIAAVMTFPFWVMFIVAADCGL